jgi:hypothetical protein
VKYEFESARSENFKERFFKHDNDYWNYTIVRNYLSSNINISCSRRLAVPTSLNNIYVLFDGMTACFDSIMKLPLRQVNNYNNFALV